MAGPLMKILAQVTCTCPRSRGDRILPDPTWPSNNERRFVGPDCGRSVRVKITHERTGITKLRLQGGGLIGKTVRAKLTFCKGKLPFVEEQCDER